MVRLTNGVCAALYNVKNFPLYKAFALYCQKERGSFALFTAPWYPSRDGGLWWLTLPFWSDPEQYSSETFALLLGMTTLAGRAARNAFLLYFW